jgi:mannose-6-phosphate isomerase-like protein (cupin superfamily)
MPNTTKPFHFASKNQAVVREISANKIAYNYISKDVSEHLSLAVTEAIDCNELEKTLYDRVYYVLEGVMVLQFHETDDCVSVHIHDSILVNAGTSYTITGSFKVIVVNSPAFGTM